ncbi:hypothetical protein ACHAXA_001030 [Cyclostephanos tholiformis]|uniref:Uncharacterized protein n=1 Tax=Cyclostephanos tholiformis TaxID=382380 RepID=A0ABD3RW78_9STRA
MMSPSTFALPLAAILLSVASPVDSFSPSRRGPLVEVGDRHRDRLGDSHTTSSLDATRREWLASSTTSSSFVLATVLVPSFDGASSARESRIPTTSSSGLLPDLPPEAVRSYLQYRFPLQLAADYYIFDLQNMVRDTDEFGAVNDLVSSKGSRGGAGGASRIERDYVNPMRIIGLSMPPDYADDIRDSQFAFERAMSKMTKATGGIRRGLSVEIDGDAVPNAVAAWEEGRLALNSFFVTLNAATGLEGELTVIPPPGPDQIREYGRSIRRYNEFMKKTRLCQNRGGPTLSAAWGQLMVSGYLQDSCGVEPMEGYFFQ